MFQYFVHMLQVVKEFIVHTFQAGYVDLGESRFLIIAVSMVLTTVFVIYILSRREKF